MAPDTTNAAPHFIGIGAQKAGTTWLYENLREQPSVWLPPTKELHYFSQKYPNPLIVPRDTLPHPTGLVNRYKLPLRDSSLSNYLWLYRFYRRENTDEWYRSLFSHRFTGGRISGDITPAYSTLTTEGINAVKKLVYHNTRVFIILRDPVERAWSSLKMLYRWRGIDVETRPESQLIADLQAPGITLRTKYSSIINAWGEVFNENFAVFYYRDLVDDPARFYRDITSFIGIPETISPSKLEQRIWTDQKSISMPLAIREYLLEYYADECRLMSQPAMHVS